MDDPHQVLAAKSAQLSRKRTRILFSGIDGTTPTFVPEVHVDAAIHKASVARRVRYRYPVIPSNHVHDQDKKKSNTLTGLALQELREDKLKALQSGDDGSQRSTNAAVEGQIVIRREQDIKSADSSNANVNAAGGVLALPGQTIRASTNDSSAQNTASGSGILVPKTTKKFSSLIIQCR